ncbi:NmrA-like family protein [Diaporthe helianthi]|uniref:NmrA-like family protein n=1 Tax=Diaporthe helianthi TaxID=158607 RepID=A0A2P5HNA4_DIAHE|nr:NmrA-like family protein [Diaporthe helianthi]
MSIVKVTLVGATGSLGAPILDALVDEGSFQITVLQRASSRAKPGHLDKIRTEAISDGLPIDELTEKLRGQDAVVVCYRAKDSSEQIKFGEAAAAAGVKRLIPADFGSCDSSGKRERELVKLFDYKQKIREDLLRLSEKHPGFSWTSLVNGHFFDWGLRESFLHFDLDARRAEIVDDGNVKSSQATLAQIARATVRILQRPEETKNRMLFIQSFCVSQNEVLRSLEKAMGVKWEVEYVDSEKFIREKKALADQGNKDAVEDLVFVLGAINGNWEQKPDFAMDLLGLQNEDLDTIVQQVVSERAAN